MQGNVYSTGDGKNVCVCVCVQSRDDGEQCENAVTLRLGEVWQDTCVMQYYSLGYTNTIPVSSCVILIEYPIVPPSLPHSPLSRCLLSLTHSCSSNESPHRVPVGKAAPPRQRVVEEGSRRRDGRKTNWKED